MLPGKRFLISPNPYGVDILETGTRKLVVYLPNSIWLLIRPALSEERLSHLAGYICSSRDAEAREAAKVATAKLQRELRGILGLKGEAA